MTVFIPGDDERVAERHLKWVASLARRLVQAKLYDLAPMVLDRAGRASVDDQADLERYVALKCESVAKEKRAPLRVSFRTLAERWTNGELNRLYPDHVRAIDHASNRYRLEAHVYPVIGSVALREVARSHADEVMRRLPRELEVASRRHVAQLISRVLRLAEFTGDIERSPLPRGWVPRRPQRKDTPILYPGEDAVLLACLDVELGRRMVYGFLHREGLRVSEAMSLDWQDLDLEHGVLQLDRNKTKHARWWKLDAGVASALRVWRELRGCPSTGNVFDAEQLRADLKRAKLDRARLFARGENTVRVGIHALRHSFVTRSLAIGRPEDWVRQRTGHTTDQLHEYREPARSLAELELGDVAPLIDAIPELARRAKTPQGDRQGDRREPFRRRRCRRRNG